MRLKEGKIDSAQDEEGIFHLIAGHLGDLTESSDVSEFVNTIASETLAVKNKVLIDSSTMLKDIEEAYYIDPYLGKFYLKTEKFPMGQPFVTKLKDKIPSLKFITSDIDIEEDTTRLTEPHWVCKSHNSFPFHDRFIVCKAEQHFFGILIGSSGTSFGKRKYFIIAKLETKDAKRLHEIATDYVVS